MQEALGPETYVFLSDVETDVWSAGTVANLSQDSARWLITRGEHGADEFDHGLMHHHPPYKVRFGLLLSSHAFTQQILRRFGISDIAPWLNSGAC